MYREIRSNLKAYKERGVALSDQIIKKHVGNNCIISTDNMATNLEGRIIDASENWIEVETTKGIELFNVQFVQNIKIMLVNN